ncbi:bifunctional phosphatase PAP2/diacylglycerol kinase family protein [Mycetocola zhujimingii]|nr:bifunctional phosphatase PAP2/diacylglycerol kinase family protein [Mycetocola zhujimingii]
MRSTPAARWRRMMLFPAWVRKGDARAGRHINSRGAPPAVDSALRHLSRSADRSVLWFAIGGGLLAMGQRRAALRGLLSLTVASAVANLVGKKLFGGDRPLTKDIPIGRRLHRSPESPSFPSGHAASAAAFATGIALEQPALGLAVAPVAGAVAYSRVHTGAHWLSDVLGGVAIGVGVAAAGKALVPAPVPRVVREGGIDIALPAAPSGDGVFIVANPSSGKDVVGRTDPLTRIGERMPHARVHILADDDTPDAVITEALASDHPPRILGVCGGDGTVSATADTARKAGLPLVVIPGGTFNHFALAVGVDSVDDALDAVASGVGARVDVAELWLDDGAPITVLNVASIGIYPEFVLEREGLEHRLGKWLSAVVAAIRVIRREEPVTLEIDGERRDVWSVFAGVNRNEPDVPAPLSRKRLDDGVLDVRILPAGSRVQAVASLAFGRRSSAVLRAVGVIRPGGVESFTTESLSVTVWPKRGQTAGFAHDGEAEDVDPDAATRDFRSTVRLVEGALDVYCPPAA